MSRRHHGDDDDREDHHAPPCFVVGTLIATPTGPQPVEALRPGALVCTLDHGPRPLRWLGQRSVPGRGRFAPVRIGRGVLGNRRPLLVSPQHRMLISGWRAELFAGEAAVLVPAIHLVNDATIRRAPRERVRYVHLLFDRHEVVRADGAWSESFHPGNMILSRDAALRAEVLALFPQLATGPPWPLARPEVRAAAAVLLPG